MAHRVNPTTNTATSIVIMWLVCTVNASVATANAVQWPVNAGGNGHYYEVVSNPQMCWTQARQDAIARGGDLVTITSAAEQQFVESILLAANPPTGAQFINLIEQGEGIYVWANGEPTGYTNWYPGEPNNGAGIESVGSMLWTNSQPNNGRSGFWNDVPDCFPGNGEWIGDYGPGGYVVEYPCEPSITSQPSPACAPRTPTFSIAVGTGARSGPFTYQWQIQTAPGVWTTLGNDPFPLRCGGSAHATPLNSPTVSIFITPCPGVSVYHIRCVVTNACGDVESDPTTLSFCFADATCDGEVNLDDLLLVINSWGPCANPTPPNCPADLAPVPSGDGIVDIDDLLAVIGAWGPCP